jgi:trans-2,3-dihydro-3-hydroxyanthranilate isomerase
MTAPTSRDLDFALVDVFTDRALSGNPLAVVPDAAGLGETLLGALAREFNQSETTFLLPPSVAGADWQLRSFTPAGQEVFGIGHNALGAWWWLAATGQLSLSQARTSFHQELGGRVFPLVIQSEGGRPRAIVMAQAAPVFGAILRDHRSLAAALGLGLEDFGPANLSPQVVSTSAPHLMVSVEPAALNQARPDRPALRAILQAHGAEGCYLFALDPDPAAYRAAARFFNPVAGIDEDPATGSAAGSLACYLDRYGAARGDRIRIAQGAATGRPSRIEVEVKGDDVQLFGRGIVVAEGKFKGLLMTAGNRSLSPDEMDAR